MPITLKDSVETYKNELDPYIDKWAGYFTLLAACLFAEYWILFFLRIDILSYPKINIFLLALLTAFLIWLYWFYLRIRPILFGKNTAGILVAITKIDSEADLDILKIYKQLNFLIGAENISKKVKVKLVPERILPQNRKEAARLLKKSGGELIIWGTADKGRLGVSKKTLFTQISFTYQLNERRENLVGLSQNLAGLLAEKRWMIDEDRELIDRQYVVQNLEGICLYIIGLIFFFRKEFRITIDLFLKFSEKNINKPLKTDNDKIALANIDYVIRRIYEEKFKKIEIWPDVPKDKKAKGIEEVKKINSEVEGLSLPGGPFNTNLLKAQICAASGDILAAIDYSETERVRVPKDAAPYFSLSFLYYSQGDIENGNKFLYEALSKDPNQIGDQLVLILRWYEGELKQNPQKLFLHFPIARINFLVGNYPIAEESFEKTIQYLEGRSDKTSLKMHRKSGEMLKKTSRKLKRKNSEIH